eukprot:TRINITY_DN286_c1_g1_i1.p4 TRINITY_DN286_c1_g1~~TRINITY_DN286_c1_g1_i1.p4  ORF type:complete len:132 (+),score=4.33 TRINITY_DN286_c1_g1_i1:173-568(+)
MHTCIQCMYIYILVVERLRFLGSFLNIVKQGSKGGIALFIIVHVRFDKIILKRYSHFTQIRFCLGFEVGRQKKLQLLQLVSKQIQTYNKLYKSLVWKVYFEVVRQQQMSQNYENFYLNIESLVCFLVVESI